jgi:hypothetical protein
MRSDQEEPYESRDSRTDPGEPKGETSLGYSTKAGFTENPIPRLPTIYSPTLLYNPAELDRKLEELKTKSGGEKFDLARNTAAVVFEDSDLNGIKELIDLENQCAPERVPRRSES